MTLGALPALALWAKLGFCIGLFHADLGAQNTSGSLFERWSSKIWRKRFHASQHFRAGSARGGSGANYLSSRRSTISPVLVGIGGGIPRRNISDNPLEDVHLGNLVVGWPGDHKPSCVYHDGGRFKVDGQFEIVGTMHDPGWGGSRTPSAFSLQNAKWIK